jgi:spermidine/putrescine ABC transporter ATP-binding subunit
VPEAAEHLRLTALHKGYGEIEAVRGLDLRVGRGEFLTLLGPSGCGKTTTLRLVAGFELPDSGSIHLSGADISRDPPYRRPVNTVFQHYALFPHLSVEENVAFGLRMRGVGASERVRRVAGALARVALAGYERRQPRQLSGGQQQRVALARALVNEPQILLLDEPLGALDLKLRRQMQVELKALHRQVGITFLYVTHDQEEALAMSDRVAVMSAGRIEQIGPPEEIYERPRNRFVADFIGDTNLIEARVAASGSGEIEARAGELVFRARGQAPAGSAVSLSIRPERWRCGAQAAAGAANFFRGRILESVYAGSALRQVVELPGGRSIVVLRPGACDPAPPGGELSVAVAPSDVVVLPSEAGGAGGA